MPVLNIVGVEAVNPEVLKRFIRDLACKVVSIEELELKMVDVSFDLPADILRHGLGEEVIIRVFDLFIGPNYPRRTDEVREKLAQGLRAKVLEYFPEATLVEVPIYPFDPSWGFAFHRGEMHHLRS